VPVRRYGHPKKDPILTLILTLTLTLTLLTLLNPTNFSVTVCSFYFFIFTLLYSVRFSERELTVHVLGKRELTFTFTICI